MGSAPIDTWQEMEAKLQEKYMHTNYNDKLCDQFINLRQNNMLVAKYMNKFDELKTRSRIIEDPQQILTRFNYSSYIRHRGICGIFIQQEVGSYDYGIYT